MKIDSKILSGIDISRAVYEQLSHRIASLKNNSIIPSLAVVLVGEIPASKIYVKSKTKKFNELGLRSSTISFSNDISEEELINKISELNVPRPKTYVQSLRSSAGHFGVAVDVSVD